MNCFIHVALKYISIDNKKFGQTAGLFSEEILNRFCNGWDQRRSRFIARYTLYPNIGDFWATCVYVTSRRKIVLIYRLSYVSVLTECTPNIDIFGSGSACFKQ